MKQYQNVIRLVDELIPYINNSRTHSDEQVTQVASSIKEFGFTNPILIDEDNGVVAGHGRLLASKKLGIDEVPCIVIDGLTEAQKKAYVIADNKLGLNSSWDEETLKNELNTLIEMDFDVSITGFDDLPDIDDVIDMSILDDDELEQDVKDGVRKCIMVDFDLDDYQEAYELFKYWREKDEYIGAMVLSHLKMEKEKHERN